MSGPGQPTTQVLLDNFLGAYPYDISAYVRMPAGINWSRGTPDEEASISNGTFGLTLDNSDGRFTYGSGTYGIGTDQAIKLIVEGTTRSIARVQSWPVSWPTGGPEWAEVQVTAVDDLARAQRRVLQAAVVEDILRDGPAALYQLSEDAGATMAGDSSGNGKPSLAIAGTGTALTFGSGTGPTDGLSCVTFAGGTFLRGTGAVWIPASSAWTVEFFFTTTMTPATASPMLVLDIGNASDFIQVAISTAGKLMGTGGGVTLTSAASVNDGLVHQGAVTLTSAGVMNLYLDGAGVGVTGATTPRPTADMVRFSVAPTDSALATSFVGTIAHVAIGTAALAGANITAHNAGVNDYLAETPAARLTRVAGYLGLATGTIDSAGTTTMGPANQTGRSGLDVIAEVAASASGAAYINGSGQLSSRNGYSFTGDLTPTATIDANYLSEDTSTEADNAFLVNYGTGKATNSENVWVAQNAFSIAVHGMYRSDYEWNVATDAQAVDRTNWKLGTYAGPTARVPQLTLDVRSLSGATRTAALALDVGKFLRITGMPSQNPGGGTLDLLVLGIAETVTEKDWTLTLNCVKHILYAAWVLEDAAWGQLDQTTKLYSG